MSKHNQEINKNKFVFVKAAKETLWMNTQVLSNNFKCIYKDKKFAQLLEEF